MAEPEEEGTHPLDPKKRRVIRSEGREMIARVYHFLREEYLFMKMSNHDKVDLSPLAKIKTRTANATGVSERTVSKILKEEKELPSNGKFQSPLDKRKKRASKFDFDNFNIDLIRSTVENFRRDYNEEPTLTKLKVVLRDRMGFNGSLTSLRRLLKKLGYKYEVIGKKRLLQIPVPKKKKKEKTNDSEDPNLPQFGVSNLNVIHNNIWSCRNVSYYSV